MIIKKEMPCPSCPLSAPLNPAAYILMQKDKKAFQQKPCGSTETVRRL